MWERCDGIRSNALHQAVQFLKGTRTEITAGDCVQVADVFHKFLLGGPQSMTKEEVVEMEAVMRQGDAETTHHGTDPAPEPKGEAA